SFRDYRASVGGIVGPKVNVVTGLPVGLEGDILRYNATTEEWEPGNFSDALPVGTEGDLLRFNGSVWESVNLTQVLPAASEGEILAFDGIEWVTQSKPVQCLVLEVGDQNIDLTTGSYLYSFTMPYTMRLTKIKAS